jgi:acetoin utilization deacetylase AcuC-like enzyme
LWHDTLTYCGSEPSGIRKPNQFNQPAIHYENAEPKRRFLNLINVTNLSEKLICIKPREATVEELERFHTSEYVKRIKALSDANGGDAGSYAPFGAGSFEIACLAAGGAIVAVDAVLDGRVDNAYVLCRPPGHHAESGEGRGFCIFNNVVIAAKHAQQCRGVKKIAIVDYDVHHGNGTEHAFAMEKSVLFISVHQDRLYPLDTGSDKDVGVRQGIGFNINIPLPPGSGIGACE